MDSNSLLEDKKRLDMQKSKINTLDRKVKFKIWDVKVITSFSITGIFIVIGFYKMLVYSNDEFAESTINNYVGGDAYNYIINSNYATGFFVLALIFTVIGCTLLVINTFRQTEDFKI